MNDFEQKIAALIFREPPAGLRAEILRACDGTAPAAWTWRDWLWPAPQAWAGLAALWLVFAAVQFAGGSSANSAAFAAQPARDDAVPAALFTFHNAHDFRNVPDLAN